MNRDNHLDRAAKYTWANKEAINLARELPSESAIADRAAQVGDIVTKNREKNRLWKRILLADVLLIVLVPTMLLTFTDPASYSSGVSTVVTATILSLFALLAVSSVVLMDITLKYITPAHQLMLLQPIVGTNTCITALEYLAEDQVEAHQWRDQAISERSQLYHFDVEILKALAKLNVEEREADRLRREAAQALAAQRQMADTAFQKIHGRMPQD